MADFGRCESTTNDRLIVIPAKRCKIVFKNDKKRPIRKVKVDGCLAFAGRKCDFLLIDPKSTEHYVELKGSDVRHAFSQIENTIRNVSVNPKTNLKHSYIISTMCPMFSTEIQQRRRQFKKDYNSTLTVKNRQIETNI